MKLKTKLYIFQIILSVIPFLFIGFTYCFYQDQYKKDLESYIEDEAALHKKAIITSIMNANLEFQKKKWLFNEVHKKAIQAVKNNPNIDLTYLQKKIEKEFQLVDIGVDLYLIDKTYTIYKTTIAKDLGLNLSAIYDAKYFLDKTSQDGEIHFTDFTSTDSLNMEYRLYSYSKIDDNSYLELGFIDKKINNSLISTIEENTKSTNKINIFAIGKNEKGFYSYEFVKNRNIEKKEEFFKNLETPSKLDAHKDDVLDVGIGFKQKIVTDNHIATITTAIFEKNMYDTLGFENIVMRLQIDISEKEKFLQNFKMLMVFSLALFSVLLIIFYIFMKKHFTNPIDAISKSLKDSQKIDNEAIFARDDELCDISKKYNILYDKLSSEIQLNQKLLEENKRFIADTVHQIRTPLTNIIMNGEMVKKFQKDDSLSIFIDKIDSSINMLSNSYEDLAYAITSDAIEYLPTNVNISSTLRSRINFFATISSVNKKEIISNIEDNLLTHINQIELERIIDNNISNGIKYAKKNELISIKLFKNDNQAILKFETYGSPIKNQDKVFERNYRENEAKRGLGLGLNMVKLICDKYEITYKTTYENGQNIFTYTFRLL